MAEEPKQEEPQELEEQVEPFQEEPSQELQELQEEPSQELQEPKRRGRPRMTPEQKREAKAARAKLKVVSNEPKKEPKPKIIERVVREYVEVPVPATVQQSPFEALGNVLRSQATSAYERKKQQWASFQLI